MKTGMINFENHYDEFIIEAMTNFGSKEFSAVELHNSSGPFLEKWFQSNKKKYKSKRVSGNKSAAENFVHRFLYSAVESGYLVKNDNKYKFDVKIVSIRRFFYTASIRKHVDYLKESTFLVGDRSLVSSRLNRIISELYECESIFRNNL